jgi:hypothetical protein
MGEEGGLKAANLLHQSASIYAREVAPELPADFKIVTRMYANVKGLGEVCSRANIISNPTLFEDFVRGFTKALPLYDFVDVGPGKDRADDKVSGMLERVLTRRSFH